MQLKLVPRMFEFSDGMVTGNYPLMQSKHNVPVLSLFQLMAYLRGECWIETCQQLFNIAKLAQDVDTASMEKVGERLDLLAVIREQGLTLQVKSHEPNLFANGFHGTVNLDLDPLLRNRGLARLERKMFDEILIAAPSWSFLFIAPNKMGLMGQQFGPTAPSWEEAIADLKRSISSLGYRNRE